MGGGEATAGGASVPLAQQGWVVFVAYRLPKLDWT